MPIDSQVEVKQVRLVKGTGTQIAAARQASEILETDLVVQTDAPELVTANTAITGATKCKITYDSKGLVTAGADLSAGDIPNLTLSKITDITATATELNYVDGVTSAIQTQLNGKQATISDLDTIRSGASAGATAVQPSAIANMQTTDNIVQSVRASSSAETTKYPSEKAVALKSEALQDDIEQEVADRIAMDNTLSDRIDDMYDRIDDAVDSFVKTTDTIPITNYDLLDVPVQYKGTTNQNYINGYFYKFTNPVYSSTVTVQTGSFTVAIDNAKFISRIKKTGVHRFYKYESYWWTSAIGEIYNLSYYGITINGTVNTGNVFLVDFTMDTTVTRIDVQPEGGGAVDSVNGQTGTVVLDAEDVGALPDSTVIPTDTADLTNGAGFITSSALSGYATQTWVGQQGFLTSTSLNGYATEQWVGQQGYLTSITSSDVTTALGYTPYNSSNPNGYTSNVGTVTSVNNVSPVNGNVTLSIPTVNNATLTIQKNGSNVATFTANSSTNQTANITVPTNNNELTNGAGYITGITGSDVTTALGYTPLQSSDILNVVNSTATNKALSANMGKELQDQIDNLKARGRYLALWNCATGLAQSNPTQSPYNYQTGDYFIIGTIATGSGTNYRPNGSSYTTGVASTTVETEPVDVNDVYYYDGTNWSLQINTQKEVTFSRVGGSPYDNSNLASALNGKQAELVSGTNIKTINNTSILGSGNLSIDSLPSQSGQNGKYLKTNGTSASWSNLDLTGYATEQWVGQQGYITGITSSDVTAALGFTPYDSSNPSGYTSNVGTVTSVNNVQPVNGNVTLSIPPEVTETTVSGWGFTKNVGTVTSVNNVSPVNGNVSLTIPTVNNSTISFTQGGVSKGSFTLNQSTADTIALDAGATITLREW